MYCSDSNSNNNNVIASACVSLVPTPCHTRPWQHAHPSQRAPIHSQRPKECAHAQCEMQNVSSTSLFFSASFGLRNFHCFGRKAGCVWKSAGTAMHINCRHSHSCCRCRYSCCCNTNVEYTPTYPALCIRVVFVVLAVVVFFFLFILSFDFWLFSLFMLSLIWCILCRCT